MSILFTGPAQVPTHTSRPHLVFPARALLSVLLALVLGLLGLGPVAAQSAIRLSTLQVSLWPEFDQLATLVILDGQLEAGVALPAELAVRIPARAGGPHAVAVTGEDGDLLTAAYTTQLAGDDIIVMFQTQFPGFRVEYYDPALAVSGEARRFDFAWPTDYAVAAAAVRVQQPVNSRDFAGEPALASVGAGADGLTYYQADLGALQPGDRVVASFSYAKSDSTLSAETLTGAALPDGQTGPVPQTVTPAADNRVTLLVVGVSALALALAAAGYMVFARRRRPQRAAASARGARKRSTAAAFCTQCGQRRLAGDRFCRNCGARAAS